jgi:hypothetical protein
MASELGVNRLWNIEIPVVVELGGKFGEETRDGAVNDRAGIETAYITCPAGLYLAVNLLVVVSFLVAASLLFLYPLLLASLRWA